MIATASYALGFAASTAPCDILAAAGTPCVAAHSLTRALYGNYSGPLYAVKRASDGAVRNISVLPAGNVADAAGAFYDPHSQEYKSKLREKLEEQRPKRYAHLPGAWFGTLLLSLIHI